MRWLPSAALSHSPVLVLELWHACPVKFIEGVIAMKSNFFCQCLNLYKPHTRALEFSIKISHKHRMYIYIYMYMYVHSWLHNVMLVKLHLLWTCLQLHVYCVLIIPRCTEHTCGQQGSHKPAHIRVHASQGEGSKMHYCHSWRASDFCTAWQLLWTCALKKFTNK